MYDIIRYTTSDGYSGSFTNKDPRPDFNISYDTRWIDIGIELEAPIDVTTIRGWTLNDEFFFGYDLGPGVENSRGIITKKKLYTSQIKARIFIKPPELTPSRQIDICITTVVCRDLERLRIGEWIFVDPIDICFSYYLTELAPVEEEPVDSDLPDLIVDDCPRIFACYADIDSADINVLRIAPDIQLDSDGITIKDPDSSPEVNIDPSGVESKDPDKDKESKQTPDGLKAKNNNTGNEANYGADKAKFNGPNGSATLGPDGLGFGPVGADGEGGPKIGPNGLSTPPYTFGPDGIGFDNTDNPPTGQTPTVGSIKLDTSGDPEWKFDPPLPSATPATPGEGTDGLSELPTGFPGTVLTYQPPRPSRPEIPDESDDRPVGHFMDYPLTSGRFVWDKPEVEEESQKLPISKLNEKSPEDKKEYFDKWNGFSDFPTTVVETFPETNEDIDNAIPVDPDAVPPQPFNPAEAADWKYNPETDTLENTTPTQSFAGFTSDESYVGYEVEATLSSDTPTDNPIFAVIAEMVDENGRKNNLSLVRRPKTLLYTPEQDAENLEPSEAPSYGVVYNYGQPDQKYFEADNSVTNAAPATVAPTLPGESTDDWVNAGPTKIKFRKEPEGISVSTGQFGGGEIDGLIDTTIEFDEFPELEKFKNIPTKWGFGSQGQPAKVNDLIFTTSDFVNEIVDVKNNKVYQYISEELLDGDNDDSGEGYYPSPTGNLNDTHGYGKFLWNPDTEMLYWADPFNKYKLSKLIETTDDLPEGDDNELYGIDSPEVESRRYFTRQRARSSVSVVDNSGIGELSYDSNTGIFTYDNIDNTDGLPEGLNNLYYTDQRARNAVSAVDNSGMGEFTYDPNTGVFTYDNVDQDFLFGDPVLEIQGGSTITPGPYLKLNGSAAGPAGYETHSSGLRLTILNSSGAFVGATTYDTNSSSAASDSLASAINGMAVGNIGILTSSGAYGDEITKQLKDVAFSNGLYKLYNMKAGSENPPYTAIFQKTSTDQLPPNDKLFKPSKAFEGSNGSNIATLPSNIKAGIADNTFYVYGHENPNVLVSSNSTPYVWIDSDKDLWSENGIMADGGRMRSQLIAAFGPEEGVAWDENRVLELSEDSVADGSSLVWGYLSHDSSNTYPARPTDDPSAWTISPSTNSIDLELRNNLSFVGLTQEDSTTTYSTSATLSSTDSSSIAIGLIIAAVEENGREYTLSALRAMGKVNPLDGYGIYYNYNQSDQKLISSKSIPTVNPLNWSGNGPVRLEYTKNTSLVKVSTSQNNSVAIDPATEININLTSDPDLIRFTNATKGGFGGLRLFTPKSYPNGLFEDPSYIQNGTTVSLSGWKIELVQTRLGIDNIGGIISPEDPTDDWTNGIKAPDGDLHPGMTYDWQYLTKNATLGGTTLGKNCIRLFSNGQLSVPAAIAHGPHLISNDYLSIPSNAKLNFYYRAAAGADAYDVLAYLLRDDGYKQILLNAVEIGRNDTGWRYVESTVTQPGNYKFVFVSGTWDETGGYVAGASLFVAEINVELPPEGDPIQVTFSDIAHSKEKVVPTPDTEGGKGAIIYVKEDIKSGGTGHHLFIENNNFCDLDEITIISGKINLISCKDDGQIYIDGNKIIHSGNLENSLNQIPGVIPEDTTDEIKTPFTVIGATIPGGRDQLTFDSVSNILQFEPIQSADEIPEGTNNVFYKDSRVLDYLTTNNYYTEGDVTNYLDTNNYYTENNVENYLTTNNYYTENNVENYLTTNNYYTESNVENYLVTNNYYTESAVVSYVDSAILEYTLITAGESEGVKLSLLADGNPVSNIHFTGTSNILVSYVPDFYKPEQIVFEVVGLDYRLTGETVTAGVKFTLLKDNVLATDDFQIIGDGLIDVSWDPSGKIVNLNVDPNDVISLINQNAGGGLDSADVISLINQNTLDAADVISLIDQNTLDSADILAISGSPENYLSDLLDVSSATPEDKDYLRWNGTGWEPATGDTYELLSDTVATNSAQIFLNQLSEGGAYPNSTFSDTSSTVSGNQVSINGWTVFKQQVRLGIDPIGGFTTPTDPTPNPTGPRGQVSAGDGTLDPSMNFFTQFTTLDGKDCIRLFSSGSVSTFGDVSHGPYLISNDYSVFQAGSSVSFSWRAAAGGDAYDVFAYLLKDDGSTQILLNTTQAGAAGDTGWLTVTDVVAITGNYKFVFVSGTFDYTFGGVAGASLYVTDVETQVGTLSGGININGGTGILVSHTSPNTITITNTGDGTGGGATTLNDLIDVNTSGVYAGDVLQYNGSSWVPGTSGTLDSADIINLIDSQYINSIVSSGQYTAGDGLNLFNNEFAVDTTVLRTNTSQIITASKKFNNGITLQFGADADMDIYHNAFDNIIDLRSGDLLIREVPANVTKFTFERTTGNFTAAGDVTAFSDERLKTKISTLENSLAKVKGLRGVSFVKDGRAGIGLIAQEVEKIVPEVVHDNEYKSVAYGNLVAVLIEAVKELSDRIEELERDR